MLKKLLFIQTIIIAGGVVFSWTNVVLQLERFYNRYGTFFRVYDCTIPNPLLTACFYGAVAFIVAAVWAGLIFQQKSLSLKSEKYLGYFLLFGTCFALSVLSYEFLTYYKIIRSSGPIISCSPGIFPLKTPCFVGMLFFLTAFLFSIYIRNRMVDTHTESLPNP